MSGGKNSEEADESEAWVSLRLVLPRAWAREVRVAFARGSVDDARDETKLGV